MSDMMHLLDRAAQTGYVQVGGTDEPPIPVECGVCWSLVALRSIDQHRAVCVDFVPGRIRTDYRS